MANLFGYYKIHRNIIFIDNLHDNKCQHVSKDKNYSFRVFKTIIDSFFYSLKLFLALTLNE